ncbi:ubiquitin-like domain-containing protein CIP73 isoform X2 [Typha angustifolia]|uniref:ubiquitin-like domain-containing protein CIP73 isoform X2 n=1 Tax=Typha angustifolia TaxID=59011 RepID=UPI003C305FBB
MGSNGAAEVSTSQGDVAKDPETTIEIKIKTLDSQTYTLRVNKRVPVPLLKEQIASVTGVVSEQQRLISRGKVLKDDELLSAYHVEDGHTLHLVARQPNQSSSLPSTAYRGFDSAPSHPATNTSSSNAGPHGDPLTHSIVFEAVNIDQGDQGGDHTSHLNRVISGLLSSIGINTGFQSTATDPMVAHASSDTGLSGSSQPHPNPASLRVELDSQQGPFQFQSPLGSQQPTVIPDSLTTIHQYLDFMRDEFRRAGSSVIGTFPSGRGPNDGVEASRIHSNEARNHEYQFHSAFRHSGNPASLAEVILSTRQLLMEQAEGWLFQLARQLEDHVNVNDSMLRMNLQNSVFRSGTLLQELGSLLLELGRTTMMSRMGEAPMEATIMAGPAVFISASGPTPLMVQPVPFYPSNIGGHLGAGYPGRGLHGESLASIFRNRNIDVHMRSGQSIPVVTANPRQQAGAQQSQEHVDSRNSSGIHAGYQAFSLNGDSAVRVVPVRTVVAVPAGVNISQSGTAGSAVGVIHPLIGRVQHVILGNTSDRVSHSSNEPSQSSPNVIQPANLEPAMQMQNLESSSGGITRNGNILLANSAPVISGSFSATQSGGQGQQEPPSSNRGSDTQNVGQQINQSPVSQLLSRVDQFLRTVFSGEQVPVGSNRQESATGSAAEQLGTSRNAEMPEVVGVTEEGVLFSNMVRQLMPFISHGTAVVPDGSAHNHSSPNGQPRESLNEQSSSRHPRDSCEGPNPKRPKKE